MTAVLNLIRVSGGMEHYVNVMVSLDRDGDVIACVMDDVPERILTARYGEPDIVCTGNWIAREGQEFELEDKEIEEARAAIASNEKAWHGQKAALFDHLRPGPEVS